MAKKKKKAKKAKKAPRKTAKKKAAKKTSRKAPKKPAKKAAKKKRASRKAAGKPSSVPARSASTPMLPGMGEGIETEEFEPEVGLVVDDDEDEVDFPETDEIVATPDLEKHADDDEGEW